MAEVSELIYETCKTYMITQGKFLLILEAFIAVIMVAYFGGVQHMSVSEVLLILAFSLVGIAGSLGVAWFGIRINTLANSRTAFAALQGKSYPVYAIPDIPHPLTRNSHIERQSVRRARPTRSHELP